MDEEERRVIGRLATTLRPMVTEVEAHGPTTADYVGVIKALIAKLGEEPLPGYHIMLGMALIRAGATPGLVTKALRMMGHLRAKPTRPRDERSGVRVCPPDED